MTPGALCRHRAEAVQPPLPPFLPARLWLVLLAKTILLVNTVLRDGNMRLLPVSLRACACAGTSPTSVPDLPRDVLRSIALRSLHAQGSNARHWLRLSLVCNDWRGFLQGLYPPRSRTSVAVLFCRASGPAILQCVVPCLPSVTATLYMKNKMSALAQMLAHTKTSCHAAGVLIRCSTCALSGRLAPLRRAPSVHRAGCQGLCREFTPGRGLAPTHDRAALSHRFQPHAGQYSARSVRFWAPLIYNLSWHAACMARRLRIM